MLSRHREDCWVHIPERSQVRKKKRRHRVGFQPYGGKNEYLAALGEERGREEEAGHGAFQVCEMI